MTLLRLVQRASILAGMTFASLSVHGNPARAEITDFCIIASNGKTVCGKSTGIERMCVTTDGNNSICGKFKSVIEGQAQEETRTPALISGYRKEADNFVLTLESCKRVDENVRCQLKIFNNGKKRDVGLDVSSSSLVDLAGRSHPGYRADFGGGLSPYPTTEIESKTDIIVSIIFENIPGKILKSQLLNLAFVRAIKPVQFRNVPIFN